MANQEPWKSITNDSIVKMVNGRKAISAQQAELRKNLAALNAEFLQVQAEHNKQCQALHQQTQRLEWDDGCLQRKIDAEKQAEWQRQQKEAELQRQAEQLAPVLAKLGLVSPNA